MYKSICNQFNHSVCQPQLLTLLVAKIGPQLQESIIFGSNNFVGGNGTRILFVKHSQLDQS